MVYTQTAEDSEMGRPRFRVADLWLTLPFLMLYWVNLAHHQLWFDELNAWGLAAASATVPQLFGYVHFEGHPWLWYGLLWLPARLTHDPVAMKWVTGVFGTAIYLMIGLFSPFLRWEKVLIFAGYFVTFEYTVTNRMYGVMFLVALVYAYRRTRRPDGVLGNVALLAVMANTDMTGVLLAGALLLEYGADRWAMYRVGGWSGAQKRSAAVAVGVFMLALAIAVGTALPAKEISWQASGRLGSGALTPHRVLSSLSNAIAGPWLPISPEFPRRFWSNSAPLQKLLVLAMPLVLFAYWRVFRRQERLLWLMGLTVGFAVLFADLIYEGRVRHWGITFVAFLVGLWLQQAGRPATQERAGVSTWAYGLLGLSAVSGVVATASSWTHPYSQAEATARWVRANEPAGVPLVSDWDIILVGVTEPLERPAYFLECRCTDSFKLFSHARDHFPIAELPGRTALAFKDLHVPEMVLITEEPLRAEERSGFLARGMSVSALVSFVGGDTEHEGYYLYRVVRGS